jgi:signal transduction histidine kinase
MRFRIPLPAQVGLVVVLFLGALVTLGITGASLVAREGRRSSSRSVLDRAGRGLEARGVPILAAAPRWPEKPESGWNDIDTALGDVTIEVLRPFDGVEGGYYLTDFQRFLGNAFPTEPPPPDPGKARKVPGRTAGPPPREYYLIENQVNAAILAGQAMFVVKDVPPSTVAIRTAPVKVGGRIIGATWVMIRLVDPLFLDRSIRGYQIAAGLALSGIVLALALTGGLVHTVRRQAVERERLQLELSRSERLAALGRLLAGVAHEVRNPLAGIRSAVQLWQRGIGPDAESMSDVVAEADRMEAIVARLLEFSRAHHQELTPGDLNEVVAEAVRLARGAAEARGVRIELDLAPGLPAARISPPALLQVFRNLTANALHFMPAGGLLRLATRHDPRRGVVEAEVTDTGPGLSPEAAAHVFEPFFTTRPDGTGLGLAIAREISVAHKGELQAVSRPGEPGATFRLTLPTVDDSGPLEGVAGSSMQVRDSLERGR